MFHVLNTWILKMMDDVKTMMLFLYHRQKGLNWSSLGRFDAFFYRPRYYSCRQIFKLLVCQDRDSL